MFLISNVLVYLDVKITVFYYNKNETSTLNFWVVTLLAQSESVTRSEKLLKRRSNIPFHIGGKLGFLNIETVVKTYL